MTRRPTGAQPAATTVLGFKSERVQRLRRLLRQPKARAEEGVFVVEGPKLIAAAVDSGAVVEAIYVAPGVAHDVVDQANDNALPVFSLAPGVAERVTDTVTSQGSLAVCRRVDVPLERLRSASLIVVAVGIQDPGNLGTILRGAGAVEEAGVICCIGTVDLYNPKCLRASAGSLFRQSVVARGDPVEVLERLGEWGVQRLATIPAGGVAYDTCDLVRPTALVLGNESRGLGPEVLRHVDVTATIPTSNGTESLNVAMASTVICFESARQRRQ
ncbi:MAG: RNA methyltransferase [Actinomycetota bacterium]|nr:RNA methyltransferase [Actinomycetota bacterium]